MLKRQLAVLPQDFGLTIHPDKSVFIPTRVLTVWGFIIYSLFKGLREWLQKRPSLTGGVHISASYTAFNNERCCHFFGHFISSAPAVKLSMFFYGNIENENADALKKILPIWMHRWSWKRGLNLICSGGLIIFYSQEYKKVFTTDALKKRLHHRLPLVPYGLWIAYK